MGQHIGEVISHYRQVNKMTQDEFAARLGVTPQAVSKWERGNGLPDISFLTGITKILGISADTLLDLDEKIVENGNLIATAEIRNNLIAEPLVLEFGEAIIPVIVEGLKTDYLNQKRIELVKKAGILLPILRMRDSVDLGKLEYQIMIYDKIVQKETINLESNMYQHLIDLVCESCERMYAEIINKQIVKMMVDTLKLQYPGVADGLIPEKISYLQLQRELQKRLLSGESIRNLIHILEQMEEEWTFNT